MAVDTEEHPYKTPKPTLCRQLIGLALAALLEPDGALHPDMDTELVVGAVQSTKVTIGAGPTGVQGVQGV